MAAQARTMARAKLPDAILLDIQVEPFPEGFPRPAGVEWSYRFSFWSPSTQNTYTIMPYNPAGEEWMGGRHDLSHREPIPERFLEFAEAVKRAQAQGMRGPPARAALALNPKGSREVVYDPLTLSEGLTWTITPRDETRAYYVRAEEAVKKSSEEGDRKNLQRELTQATAGANLDAVKARLLQSKLDLSRLPRGFSARSPALSEVDPKEREQGVVWIVEVAFQGPARIPKGAEIKGDPGLLKTEGMVYFTAYRDQNAAEQHFWRWEKNHAPPGQQITGGPLSKITSCTHGGMFGAKCIKLDERLPIIVEVINNDILRGGMEEGELAELSDTVDFPLIRASADHLSVIVAAVSTKEPRSEPKKLQEAEDPMKGLVDEIIKHFEKNK